jgi:hypothetical protein
MAASISLYLWRIRLSVCVACGLEESARSPAAGDDGGAAQEGRAPEDAQAARQAKHVYEMPGMPPAGRDVLPARADT